MLLTANHSRTYRYTTIDMASFSMVCLSFPYWPFNAVSVLEYLTSTWLHTVAVTSPSVCHSYAREHNTTSMFCSPFSPFNSYVK